MNLKDTKIFIPEIPKEWKKRIRSGHTNIWNENLILETKLEPPAKGLYAERFEDGWYWVCGCEKCLGKGGRWSYIVCEEHDRCITCGTHRKDLTEIPWGTPDGFECKPCRTFKDNERKTEALNKAKRNDHSEDDCMYTDKIICPVCASECSNDDMHEPGEHEIECPVCELEFMVEVEYKVSYTSKLKK